MNKKTFISTLRKKLTDNNVIDVDDIIYEYEDHIICKLLDGYSEEEICNKLGDPIEIANQYLEYVPTKKQNKKIPVYIGLFSLDFIVILFAILFVGWIISLLASSIATFAIGLSLFTTINPYNLIPDMPYWCGAVLGISMVSLSVLLSLFTYYNYLYLKQLFKSYSRFRSNTISHANNRPQLPSIPTHPQLGKKQGRRLRSVLLLALNAFAISFVLGYLVCSLTAKSFEFWHVFGWFV